MTTVRYGETEIAFSLIRRHGTTIAITVRPDQSVVVRAPNDADLEAIRARVLRRARWILRQQVALARFEPRPTPRQYVSGETHRYLGRQYLLKVVANGKGAVRLARPRLEVHVQGTPTSDATRRLVARWYRSRAEAVFADRWPKCMAKVERYQVPAVPFHLRNMPTRWGSFTPSRRILLNPELVKAPTECIDYVMLHELCHLRYPRHDWRFYRLLSRVCPEWQRLKEKLEGVET
ncbi:SprT family zinc-dependent metalloprotease [Opitutales bacterium ASA1]|uniref:M48 family metallopeptidase n=1 Tax=Congregicoccus parvus TaxID=3081749 RepID=UPI002B281FF2|nr:SprT family zinc-dependent metalloprotease [Opitutales bacterium ASA1]